MAIYSSLMPFILPLIYTIIIILATDNLAGGKFKQKVLNVAFPILITLGIVFSNGLFVMTPVKDREEKLRYLLNFAGMRSSAYYLGFLLADVIIYCIPQVLLVIMVFVIQLDVLEKHMGFFFLSIFFFAFPFISLIYNLGFVFDKSETAFKYVTLLFMLSYIVPVIIESFVSKSPAVILALEILFPLITLNNNIRTIIETPDNQPYEVKIYTRWLFCLFQCLLFMTICIKIDNNKINSFKGKDN